MLPSLNRYLPIILVVLAIHLSFLRIGSTAEPPPHGWQRPQSAASKSAKEPPADPSINILEATLDAAEPVPLKKLVRPEKFNAILAPRPDIVIPGDLVFLLKDETFLRAYPSCRFEMVEGKPTWSWTIGSHSGIHGNAEKVQERLTQRLLQLGFSPFESPNERMPLAFRREHDEFQETVLLERPVPFTGDQTPTVGLHLRWAIRSNNRSSMPTLGQVWNAMPTLQPPRHGMIPIPLNVLKELPNERVTSVSLSGTGRTSYALRIGLPKPNDESRPPVIAKIKGMLETQGFKPMITKRMPNEPPGLFHLWKRTGIQGDTSNCQVEVETHEETFHVSMRVQIPLP